MRMVLIALLIFLSPATVWATDWTDPANGCIITALFDESSGDAADSCGTATDGTVSDATYGETGAFGDAYLLGGSGEVAFGSSADIDDLIGFSIVLWVEFDAESTSDRIAAKQDGTGIWIFGISGTSSNYIRFFKDQNTSDIIDQIINGYNISSGLEHFAMTWDGNDNSNATDVNIYVDGVLFAEQSRNAGGSHKSDASSSLSVGSSVVGTIDEFGLFSTELSITDVNDIMDNGLVQAGAASNAQVIQVSEMWL